MPVSRMRMRPWLENVIESQSIPGLNWMNKEKTMFSIPWKHAARHGWELEKDASLFKMWAIHTGKYVEGQSCDPKTWKANFRCAMNSLPDIEEVKDKSINKGHQAVRVFRMLPSTPKSKAVKQSKAKDSKRRRKNAEIKMEEEEEEEEEYDNTRSPVSSEASSSTQENTVDSTVTTPQRDIPMLSLPDVPDWSNLVEIGSDYKSSFFHKLEVSPEHSFDYDQDIIQICEELERESVSPGSPWSDSSSGDDTDDLPQYTTLSSGFLPITDPWAGFFREMSL